MIAAKAAMPAAVLRTIAPSPIANRPASARYTAAPITARTTPAYGHPLSVRGSPGPGRSRRSAVIRVAQIVTLVGLPVRPLVGDASVGSGGHLHPNRAHEWRQCSGCKPDHRHHAGAHHDAPVLNETIPAPPALTTGIWLAGRTYHLPRPDHWGLAEVRHSFDRFEGGLEINDAGTTGELGVHTDSLDTKNERRDKHLRSADFDATSHLRMTFTATAVRSERCRNFRSLTVGSTKTKLEATAARLRTATVSAAPVRSLRRLRVEIGTGDAALAPRCRTGSSQPMFAAGTRRRLRVASRCRHGGLPPRCVQEFDQDDRPAIRTRPSAGFARAMASRRSDARRSAGSPNRYGVALCGAGWESSEDGAAAAAMWCRPNSWMTSSTTVSGRATRRRNASAYRSSAALMLSPRGKRSLGRGVLSRTSRSTSQRLRSRRRGFRRSSARFEAVLTCRAARSRGFAGFAESAWRQRGRSQGWPVARRAAGLAVCPGA